LTGGRPERSTGLPPLARRRPSCPAGASRLAALGPAVCSDRCRHTFLQRCVRGSRPGVPTQGPVMGRGSTHDGRSAAGRASVARFSRGAPSCVRDGLPPGGGVERSGQGDAGAVRTQVRHLGTCDAGAGIRGKQCVHHDPLRCPWPPKSVRHAGFPTCQYRALSMSPSVRSSGSGTRHGRTVP
jgi:hypothetical protein